MCVWEASIGRTIVLGSALVVVVVVVLDSWRAAETANVSSTSDAATAYVPSLLSIVVACVYVCVCVCVCVLQVIQTKKSNLPKPSRPVLN